MKNSLYIGSPFGIRITVHWTFLILIAIIVFINIKNGNPVSHIFLSVIFVFAIFGCVVLHELGHSLAARRYGISTKGITLLPIGGVARLTKIPEEPHRELFVAVAGPLVNVAIALIIAAILFFTGYNFSALSFRYLNIYQFLPALLIINISLVIFNLIPAFPMDGGRLLRAVLAFKLTRIKATSVAAKTGQLIAIGFAAWGIFNNPLLVIIAVFVFIGARAELQDVRSKSLLEGKITGDLMLINYTHLNPGMKIRKAIEILLNGHEDEFIILENNQVTGLLSKKNILKGVSEYGPDIEIERIMNKNFFTVDINDFLKDVYENFQNSGQIIAPVFENNILAGIIDIEIIKKYIFIKEASKI